MDFQIDFPDGEVVAAYTKGSTIAVGRAKEGAEEGGVEPLDLFFISLGLCAGKYVMEFCRPRNIPYEDARICLSTQWDEQKKMHTRIKIHIDLPEGFPEKYRKAILKAVDLCSVKKHILQPPAFEVEAVIP
jgi:putative redox protein